jgi:hypothetical protein
MQPRYSLVPTARLFLNFVGVSIVQPLHLASLPTSNEAHSLSHEEE